MLDAIIETLSRTEPVIWGGDCNHALSGREYAGSAAGRAHPRTALGKLGLSARTQELPHRIEGLLSIDHIAAPTGWPARAAERIPATPTAISRRNVSRSSCSRPKRRPVSTRPRATTTQRWPTSGDSSPRSPQASPKRSWPSSARRASAAAARSVPVPPSTRRWRCASGSAVRATNCRRRWTPRRSRCALSCSSPSRRPRRTSRSG